MAGKPLAGKSLSEGKKMVLCSEALKAFVIQKQVDGLSPRSVDFHEGKIEMFIAHVSDKPARACFESKAAMTLHT